ncbi:sensor histidine kinase [Kribbella catacumbae]|uniref:sensor histidine kinase n=1 Tax=Kribbella catacumbae TaxID=460086 RepID=UPI0003770CD9|nr:sensor histidine kinase [Kribbella catacumbae]
MVEDTRWDRAQPVLPYLFILLPAVFALLRDWRPEALLLPLALGGWHWLMVDWRRIKQPLAMIAYFAGLLAVLAVLLRIDSVFFVTGIGAFVLAFTLLPRWWAYVGVAATAGVLVGVPARSGSSARELIFSFLVAVLIASAVGLSTRVISEQSEQRKVMIGRLQELAEENAELQARLLTQAREAGVLDERQRMAREIHDTIAQSLTGILTQLEADGGAATAKRLETVRGLARDALTEARRSVQALRPAPLDNAQLATALREVADKWSQTSEVAASVDVTGDARPLHVEVEVALLRVAQEALANVGKHARATRVGITLSYMEDVVALDVRDDGAGFVPARTAGFGLVAMRQRITRLAGAFEVETAPGQGTGISATVPAIPPEGSAS